MRGRSRCRLWLPSRSLERGSGRVGSATDRDGIIGAVPSPAGLGRAITLGSPRPVPPGLIAFDRYDTAFGAEGPYIGSALIRGDGPGRSRWRSPVASEVWPAWSPDGDRSWSIRGPRRRAPVPASSRRTNPSSRRSNPRELAPLRAAFDWSRDGEALLRDGPTRIRTSTASTCSGVDDLGSNALPKARTTTPLDQPGSAAAATAAPCCPRTDRSSRSSGRAAGQGKSVGRRVGGDRADEPRRHRPARARGTGQGQKPSRFADLMVAGRYVDRIRQPGRRPVPR